MASTTFAYQVSLNLGLISQKKKKKNQALHTLHLDLL